MGILCIVGGVTGFARTKSIPSLVAGVGYAVISRLAITWVFTNYAVSVHSTSGAQTASDEALPTVSRVL